MLGNGLDIGSNCGIYILVGKTQINEVFCLTKWWNVQWRKRKKKNKARAVGRAVTGGCNFKLSGYHWGEVRDTVGKGFPVVEAAGVKVLRMSACLECVRKHEGHGCWVNLGWEEQLGERSWGWEGWRWGSGCADHACVLSHFSSAVGFSRQEYWNGLPCLPPGDLPNPGIEATSLIFPELAGGFFITNASWEDLYRACLTTKVLYWFLSTVSVSPHTQSNTTTHTQL